MSIPDKKDIGMTILEKVKNYYQINSADLNSFLETTSFHNTNAKYPNSVVIKFGATKIIGEISVWQYDTGIDSYIDYECCDLTKPNEEPIFVTKTVALDTVVNELASRFDGLRKLCAAH